MSLFSRILFAVATVIGFVWLLYANGLPETPKPNPEAFTDVALQPILGVMWGLIGYLINATVFGGLVTLASKVVRAILGFISGEGPGRSEPPESQKNSSRSSA